MELKRLDHVGVIVEDLDAAAELLADGMGLEPVEAIERDELRVAFFACGEVKVELIEPIDPDLRRERLGDGVTARIEHIAFDVANLEATLTALAALGVRPNAPTLHHGGRSMAWTDPATSSGIMFQFVQRGT